MRSALQCTGIDAADVDYVNLHGTGTKANDTAEDMAVAQVFGDQILCSATKGSTGHALGAAGIVESLICCLAIDRSFVPGTANLSVRDTTLKLRPAISGEEASIGVALTNSFGFGGSNCSLLFGK